MSGRRTFGDRVSRVARDEHALILRQGLGVPTLNLPDCSEDEVHDETVHVLAAKVGRGEFVSAVALSEHGYGLAGELDHGGGIARAAGELEVHAQRSPPAARALRRRQLSREARAIARPLANEFGDQP